MKQSAGNTVATVPEVYNTAAANLAANPAAAAVLQTRRQIDSTLYRSKRKNLPPLPQRREDIELPDWLTVYWNMYGIERRTNNDVEGWHNRFRKSMGRNHPNIYLFTEATLKEQACTEVMIAQLEAGANVAITNKKYTAINRRIGNLKRQFDNGDINVTQYVSGVSHSLGDF